MASPFVELRVGERTVKVTNPDKPTFPAAGLRKIDVIEYYLAVGEGILRALHERPVTLER
jgi:DNA primase